MMMAAQSAVGRFKRAVKRLITVVFSLVALLFVLGIALIITTDRAEASAVAQERVANRDQAVQTYAAAASVLEAKQPEVIAASQLLSEVGQQVVDLSSRTQLRNAIRTANQLTDSFEIPSRIPLRASSVYLENANDVLAEIEFKRAELNEAVQALALSHQHYLDRQLALEHESLLVEAVENFLYGHQQLSDNIVRGHETLRYSAGRVDDETQRYELSSAVYRAENARDTSVAEILGLNLVRVIRVIDGDTIEVDYHGARESVRLIGVDTPERNEPGFAEATEFTRGQINQAGGWVWLQQHGPDRDGHDRLRRCVFLSEGTGLLNSIIIANGYGVRLDVFGTCDSELAAAHLDSQAVANAALRTGTGQAVGRVNSAVQARDVRIAEEERLAEERRLEQERLAAERRAEQQRLAEQRAAERRAAAAQSATQQSSNTSNQSGSGGHGISRFRNCTHVWEVLNRPIRHYEAGFHAGLDRDNDGVGCEVRPGTFGR